MPDVRVYANRQHLAGLQNPSLNDLCKAVWCEEPPQVRVERYGSRARLFCATESPTDADLWVLPLVWNDYLNRGLVSSAAHEAQRAAAAGRPLLVFSQGDFTARLPFSNAIVFERGAYASRRNLHGNHVFAEPAFIPDYAKLYSQGRVQVRPKRTRPLVGFCGQAGGNWLDLGRRELFTQWRKLAFALRLRKWEPAPYETTRFRMRVLQKISQHPGVDTDYLIRRRYRAGYLPKVKDPYHPTRLEFVNNILNTDYTVCMRGGGNFSVRIYETLALGRIPVFVNTDCLLPYADRIDYRRYCVWVEKDEINKIGEKILAFHEALSPQQFEALQIDCHRLWREWLSIDGYYEHFMEHVFERKPECV